MERVFLDKNEFVQPDDRIILDLINSCPGIKSDIIEAEEDLLISEIKMLLRNIQRMDDIAISQKISCINISVRIFKREGMNNCLVDWAEQCFDEINFLLKAKRRGYERVVEYMQLKGEENTGKYYPVNLPLEKKAVDVKVDDENDDLSVTEQYEKYHGEID